MIPSVRSSDAQAALVTVRSKVAERAQRIFIEDNSEIMPERLPEILGEDCQW
jgi:hypothetical protein